MRVTYRCEYVVSEAVDSLVLPAFIAHHSPAFVNHAIALRGLSWYVQTIASYSESWYIH
jgi:hypothetical protein